VKIVWQIILCVFLGASIWGDSIRLKNGQQYVGKVLANDPDSVVIEDMHGIQTRIAKSNIDTIIITQTVPTPESTINTHDGLFFNIWAGTGFQSSEIGGNNASAFGGSIGLTGVSGLIVRIGGAGVIGGFPIGDGVLESSYGALMLGVDYYFMPSNIFLGAEIGDTIERISSGVALGAHIGKEWWVSDEWAIGLKIFANFANTGYNRYSTIGLAATATYN
jgi:hypothetical protein